MTSHPEIVGDNNGSETACGRHSTVRRPLPRKDSGAEAVARGARVAAALGLELGSAKREQPQTAELTRLPLDRNASQQWENQR